MFTYFKKLVRSNTGESSKSFGLVLSAIIGAVIGICICFILIYDVIIDGCVTTDLDKLGWFLLADSAYIFGGGLNKVLAEKFEKRPGKEEEQEE